MLELILATMYWLLIGALVIAITIMPIVVVVALLKFIFNKRRR